MKENLVKIGSKVEINIGSLKFAGIYKGISKNKHIINVNGDTLYISTLTNAPIA